jgi:hypothetical protein
MRRWAAAAAVALAMGACGAQSSAPPSLTAASSAQSPPLSPDPSPSFALRPGEMPTTFAEDADPPELPAEDLVPLGADVTGEWFGFTDDGVVVLVAWVEPGIDFSRLARGLAIWHRHASAPHWRVGLVERHDADEGIQEIQISTTDMSGDGSDDALVFEGIGGSGTCGRWFVIDLVHRRETYRREICDGRIDAGPMGSPGLIVTESVYRRGDAHCCPSAMRETTLAWTGDRWRVTDRSLIER